MSYVKGLLSSSLKFDKSVDSITHNTVKLDTLKEKLEHADS